MTLDDLLEFTKVLPATEGGWTAAMSEVLESFSKLADEGRMSDFVEFYHLFIDAHPGATAFLSHTLPLLVLGHHPALRERRVVPGGLRWTEANPDCVDRLRAALIKPAEFVAVVDEIVAACRKA